MLDKWSEKYDRLSTHKKIMVKFVVIMSLIIMFSILFFFTTTSKDWKGSIYIKNLAHTKYHHIIYYFGDMMRYSLDTISTLGTADILPNTMYTKILSSLLLILGLLVVFV